MRCLPVYATILPIGREWVGMVHEKKVRLSHLFASVFPRDGFKQFMKIIPLTSFSVSYFFVM